jgi:hypothetical protein
VSKGLEHYTQLLTRYLAIKYLGAMRCNSCINAPKPTSENQPASTPDWESRLGKEKVIFRNKLKGEDAAELKTLEDAAAIGGLRDTQWSVSKLPHLAQWGAHHG